jgi:hypothetical protein
MNGTPPSARQISAAPELHAIDFAERYAEPLDYHAAQVMGKRLEMAVGSGPGVTGVAG